MTAVSEIARRPEPVPPAPLVKMVIRPMTKARNLVIANRWAGGTFGWPRRSTTSAENLGAPHT